MPLDDEILAEAKQTRDRLIGAQHEVDAARADYHHAIRRLCAAGGSMREIAEALGISHQRVHQIVEEATKPLWVGRGRMFARRGGFTRFTRIARSVMVAAQDEARALASDHIGTGHVLLGLLVVDESLAGVLGVTAETLRQRIGTGSGSPASELPFAPETKKLLEQALRKALSMKRDHIGNEHLVLAVADEEDVLNEFGLDGDRIRAEVHRLLAA